MVMMFSYLPNYRFTLKTAFWHVAASFTAVTTSAEVALTTAAPGATTPAPKVLETDYAELWVRGGECMLTFRGSDSDIDMANNAKYSANATYHGLKLHEGIRLEWTKMFDALTAAKAFAIIRQSCAKPVTVAGHSLGAAMAQMFAVMANKRGDPLLMGVQVGAIHGFGAMPIGHEDGKPPSNGKSSDGCFKGGVYGSAAHKAGGVNVIDPAFTMIMRSALAYRHVKTTTVVMFSPTEKKEYPCGYGGKWWEDYTPDSKLLPLHDIALTSNNVAC